MKMLSRLPVSLLAFPFAALLYGLQAFPGTGVFLMFVLAPVWNGMIVIAGLIGLLVEVPLRRHFQPENRVSLFWLAAPLAFFGWYWISVFSNHNTFDRLRSEYIASNDSVAIQFDPEKQSLVFATEDRGFAEKFVKDYGLAVAYYQNDDDPAGYVSIRLIEREFCEVVSNDAAASAASIETISINDGNRMGKQRAEYSSCLLRLPELPAEPIVTVAAAETETSVNGLPVKQTETSITTPHGTTHVLRSGFAAPYPWFPFLVMGCALNSARPSWECFKGLQRDRLSIIPGAPRFERDDGILAKTLRLQVVQSHQRNITSSNVASSKIQQAQELRLKTELSNLETAISDPSAPMTLDVFSLLELRPDVLTSNAGRIVAGLQRAAVRTKHPKKHRRVGRSLAQLFARLPIAERQRYGQAIIGLYENADKDSWLWDSAPLLRVLGDFGPRSIPILLAPRASAKRLNGAAVEGLCRAGADAKPAADLFLTCMLRCVG